MNLTMDFTYIYQLVTAPVRVRFQEMKQDLFTCDAQLVNHLKAFKN